MHSISAIDGPIIIIGGTGITKPEIKVQVVKKPPITKNGTMQYLTIAAEVIIISRYCGLQQRTHTTIFNIPKIKGDRNIKEYNNPLFPVKIFEIAI